MDSGPPPDIEAHSGRQRPAHDASSPPQTSPRSSIAAQQPQLSTSLPEDSPGAASVKPQQQPAQVGGPAKQSAARRNTRLSNSIRRLLTFVRNPSAALNLAGSDSPAPRRANGASKSRKRPSQSANKVKSQERRHSPQAPAPQWAHLKSQSAPSTPVQHVQPVQGAHQEPTTSSLEMQEQSPTHLSQAANAGSEHRQSKPSSTATDAAGYIECRICVLVVEERLSPQLDSCKHRVCLECMQRYLATEINNSRLNITCPVCTEHLHPNTIKRILQDERLYLKYESFMLRRVLAAEPDARWCPAPDCSYAVLATGCASCPKLICARPGCATSFCYHCKQVWHPDQTCRAASLRRQNRSQQQQQQQQHRNQRDLYHLDSIERDPMSARSSTRSSQHQQRPDDIKECPVCASRIVKMNDGSCNHMTCSICEAEFCWLCMKVISDLHYFSPSGCTFWGKKPWSRKKKLFWQLGMLIGAPICIILIAGVAVPAIVVGIPVWTARKLRSRLEQKQVGRYRKNAITAGGVILSLAVSPFVAAVALAIGIPFLLGYVYGVVPLSLCRSSGGCLSSKPSLENFQQTFQAERIVTGSPRASQHQSAHRRATHKAASFKDAASIDTALSHRLGAEPSIGETSLHMSDISLDIHDRESASNAALAGSILSHPVVSATATTAATEEEAELPPLSVVAVARESGAGGCVPIPQAPHANKT